MVVNDLVIVGMWFGVYEKNSGCEFYEDIIENYLNFLLVYVFVRLNCLFV